MTKTTRNAKASQMKNGQLFTGFIIEKSFFLF